MQPQARHLFTRTGQSDPERALAPRGGGIAVAGYLQAVAGMYWDIMALCSQIDPKH
jgi:hypothetical protein